MGRSIVSEWISKNPVKKGGIRMSIFRKTVIFIGSGLLVIGIIMAILAFAFGGRIQNTNILDRIDLDQNYEGVESIVIQYSAGSIRIKEGDSFRIVAENVVKERFDSTVENGVWTVTDKRKSVLSFLGNVNFGNDNATVTLYIPKDVKLKDCRFELGAGKLEADTIATEKFDIKVGAGEVVINDMSAKDTTFDCGVGSIKINGEITGDSKMNCGIGEIAVSLKGDPDSYDYSVKVGIGTTKINGDVYSGVSDKKITHDKATGTFNLDCGIGEIRIEIKPE